MSDDTQQVKLLLAGLRYPALPEHVAARVDAAIAAEVTKRAATLPQSRLTENSVSWPALADLAANAREQAASRRQRLALHDGQIMFLDHDDILSTIGHHRGL